MFKWARLTICLTTLGFLTPATLAGGAGGDVNWLHIFGHGGYVGDVEGDGDLDLFSHNGLLYLNDGAAVFTVAYEVPPFFDEAADFNGDGLLDLLIIIGGGAAGVRLNNGDGTFGEVIQVGPDNKDLDDVAAGDMDGDGDIDVIKAFNQGALAVYFNDGTGHFPTSSGGGGGTFFARLNVGDLDTDGDLDVIVTDIDYADMNIHFGDGSGGWASSQIIDLGVCANYSNAIGDLNGDRLPDILVASTNDFCCDQPGALQVLWNLGGSAFADPVPLDLGDAPRRVHVADLDGDGSLDIMLTNGGYRGDPVQPEVTMVLNEGNGTFGPEVPLNIVGNVSFLADMDGDLDPDLVLFDAIYANLGIGCLADVDESGQVDFLDLLSVLSSWGPCDACPEDLDDDGVVGFLDLLLVLSNWGPCE